MKNFEALGLKAYIAVDIQKQPLVQFIKEVCEIYDGQQIHVFGIHATFSSAYKYLQHVPGVRNWVCLGSMFLGGYSPRALQSHKEQLKDFCAVFKHTDNLLISHDGHGPEDEAKVVSVYETAAFEEFKRKGIMRFPISESEWSDNSEIRADPVYHYRSFIEAKRDTKVGDINIKAGYQLEYFSSMKLSYAEVQQRCHDSSLSIKETWEIPPSKMRK